VRGTGPPASAPAQSDRQSLISVNVLPPFPGLLTNALRTQVSCPRGAASCLARIVYIFIYIYSSSFPTRFSWSSNPLPSPLPYSYLIMEQPLDLKSIRTTVSSGRSGSSRDLGTVEENPTGFVRGFFDSFRPAPNWQPGKPVASKEATGTALSLEDAVPGPPAPPLCRKLKGRHLQMIAIGGSIGKCYRLLARNAANISAGTGLFVSSGGALAVGGPGALLVAFALIGAMLFCTIQALGEMAVLFPVAGSFSAYSTRFLDPAWGFAMGWK